MTEYRRCRNCKNPIVKLIDGCWHHVLRDGDYSIQCPNYSIAVAEPAEEETNGPPRH